VTQSKLPLPPGFRAGGETSPRPILPVRPARCFSEAPCPSHIPAGFNRILHPRRGVRVDVDIGVRFRLDGESLFLAAWVNPDRNRLNLSVCPINQPDVEDAPVEATERLFLADQLPGPCRVTWH